MGEYSGVASGLMGAFGGTPRRNLQQTGQGSYMEQPRESMGFWSWLQQQGYTSDQINEVRTNPGMMAYLYEMWQTQTTRGDNQGGGTGLPTDVETEAARRSGSAFMNKNLFDQGLSWGTPEVRVPGPNDAPGASSTSMSPGMEGESDLQKFIKAHRNRPQNAFRW